MSRNLALLACLLALVTPASATERESLEALRATTLELIRQLVEQKVLAPDKAARLIEQAEAAASAAPPAESPASAPGTSGATAGTPEAAPGAVRVPYVPQLVREEIKNELKAEVLATAREERWAAPDAVPGWLDRITVSGDVRVRGQFDRFQDGNVAGLLDFQATNRARSPVLLNTTEDRERERLRARLAVDAQVGEGVAAGLRVTTGNTLDPVSTNQTLGNGLGRYAVVLDRAFLKLQPWPWLNVAAGRFENPFLGTDLVWDEDLNFDGLALSLQPTFRKRFQPFLHAGAFPLQEIELGNGAAEPNANDKWLYGAQLGLRVRPTDKVSAALGVAYYDYQDITGRLSEPNGNALEYTAPPFLQKGNTLFLISSDPARPLYGLASDCRLLNLTGSIEADAGPFWLKFDADFVTNHGFDAAEVAARTGAAVPERADGYLARLSFGRPTVKRRHDWQVSLAYRRLEADATLDAFTDSDFALGGTNAEGYVLGLAYGLAANTWLNLRWLSADEVDGPPLAVDVLQLDLNTRF